jgi:hypothetical protein
VAASGQLPVHDLPARAAAPGECPTHGVRQVRLPWAEVRARFTALFERLAIDVLQETDVRGATRILRISWDEACISWSGPWSAASASSARA